jgi:hypothetical protein
MSTAEFARKVISMIDPDRQSHPGPVGFEMAYQARVAIDRIRFAIRVTEINREQSEPLQDARMQLLDALERLEAAERRFQDRWRSPNRFKPQSADPGAGRATNANGRAAS